MTDKNHRSWLIVPMAKPERIDEAARSAADVVVLDLVEFVEERDRPAARERVRAAIETVKNAGRDVFVQIDPAAMKTDLDASVWPGLNGIVISRAESAAQIGEADAMLTSLEGARGLSAKAVKIVPALETARGNQDAYQIGHASERVAALTLGRADLIMDLRPEPSGEIHLMPYLMQRLVIVAGTLDVTPIGAWWRAPDRGLLATAGNTAAAAKRGRAIGFKGAMCLRADQVDPINHAFGSA